MFRTTLASSRFPVPIAIVATFLGAVALRVLEAAVVVTALFATASSPEFMPDKAKRIALGAALALVIDSLTFFLAKKHTRKG